MFLKMYGKIAKRARSGVTPYTSAFVIATTFTCLSEEVGSSVALNHLACDLNINPPFLTGSAALEFIGADSKSFPGIIDKTNRDKTLTAIKHFLNI